MLQQRALRVEASLRCGETENGQLSRTLIEDVSAWHDDFACFFVSNGRIWAECGG
jgi:hypothetical protein